MYESRRLLITRLSVKGGETGNERPKRHFLKRGDNLHLFLCGGGKPKGEPFVGTVENDLVDSRQDTLKRQDGTGTE